jgi:hypothetical protein
VPLVLRGGGLPFGAAVWLFADELAVPATGLSDGRDEGHPARHLESLTAHLLFGAATGGALKLLLRR